MHKKRLAALIAGGMTVAAVGLTAWPRMVVTQAAAPPGDGCAPNRDDNYNSGGTNEFAGWDVIPGNGSALGGVHARIYNYSPYVYPVYLNGALQNNNFSTSWVMLAQFNLSTSPFIQIGWKEWASPTSPSRELYIEYHNGAGVNNADVALSTPVPATDTTSDYSILSGYYRASDGTPEFSFQLNGSDVLGLDGRPYIPLVSPGGAPFSFPPHEAEAYGEVKSSADQMGGDDRGSGTREAFDNTSFYLNGGWYQFNMADPTQNPEIHVNAPYLSGSPTLYGQFGIVNPGPGSIAIWDWACPNSIVAVTGTANQLYQSKGTTQGSDENDFFGMGGSTSYGPSVAHYQSNGHDYAYYFVAGAGGTPYVRTDSIAWTPMSTDPRTSCVDAPGVFVASVPSTLYFACMGTDQHLYEATASMPSGGVLPQFGSMTNEGGTLTAGPTLAYVGTAATVTVLVTGLAAPNGTDVYSTPFGTSQFSGTSWTCQSRPSLTWNAGNSFFACAGAVVNQSNIWFANYPSSGTGWSASFLANAARRGQGVGGVGLAMSATGDVSIFVEGTDSRVWGDHVPWGPVDTGWNSYLNTVVAGTTGTGASGYSTDYP